MAGVPNSFFWRRMHSLTGLWLSIFLLEHMLTNSQAALWLGDDGAGFVRMVNWIKNLPYLQLIEIFLLGMPILVHLFYGLAILRTSEPNSMRSDGTKTELKYKRNKAYTWQRITSWILLFLLIGHIGHMRFYRYPASASEGKQHYYMVKVDQDKGLRTVADRLDVQLYTPLKIEEERLLLEKTLAGLATKQEVDPVLQQQVDEQEEFYQALVKRPIVEGQVVVVAKDFGTAELFVVRETFKMPVMLVLYTIFVLSACFHGYNGLWTFFITWGITVTDRSQAIARKLTNGLMYATASMGLAAIWLTYWMNLKQ